MDNLSDWIGKKEVQQDVASLRPAMALAATLDRTDLRLESGAALPALWHWLYFLPLAPHSSVGSDGHPKRGGFLPPIQLPRRMWAGSRVEFLAPIAIGAELERLTTITKVEEKKGRSGTLCFLTLKHELKANGVPAVCEEQDIVYREATAQGQTPAVPVTSSPEAPPEHQWTRTVFPDPVLLFRYSALTFNAHRIHYDRDYAMKEEGYPGLVVHGPLQATLLLDLVSRNLPGAQVKSFRFRAKSPLFGETPFDVCASQSGKAMRLWTGTAATPVAVEAELELQ